MSASKDTIRTRTLLERSAMPWPDSRMQRPSSRWSDIWKAPVHDFPVRDEILYQYLPLSSGMEVLEIGPGSGFTAFRLVRRVRHLTLLEVAAANVAQLQTAFKDTPNVNIVCGDICKPGLAELLGVRFDAVFALEVFELLPDPVAALKNMAALLRPEGQLLLQFPNYPPPKSPGVTHFNRREELDRLLDEAGFKGWEVHALRLRPHAHLLYQYLHERPLRLYRQLRSRNKHDRPLIYDQSWVFHHQQALERYKYLLHGAWMMLSAAMRLGGAWFERTLLDDEILNRNLLVLARR